MQPVNMAEIRYIDLKFSELVPDQNTQTKATRMSYLSPKHHHHAKHPRVSWGDNSFHEYKVYAGTMEPMPYQSYRSWEYPDVDLTFNNNNYEERRNHHHAPRARIIEYDQCYPQPVIKPTEKYQVEEDVNKEADDFIKLEHKKFARFNSSMSLKD